MKKTLNSFADDEEMPSERDYELRIPIRNDAPQGRMTMLAISESDRRDIERIGKDLRNSARLDA